MSALTDILQMVVKGLPKTAARESSKSGIEGLEQIAKRTLKTEGDDTGKILQREAVSNIAETEARQIPLIDYPMPKQEWWQDELERTGKITLWHGTDKRNLPSIQKSGILPDSNNKTYASLDPDTGFGYGQMARGEKAFLQDAKKGKAKNNPFEDRALLQLEIPKEYFEKYLADQRSNFSVDRLLSPNAREKFRPYDFDLNQPYYALTELRFNGPIPPEFIVGWTQRPDRKLMKKVTEKSSGGSIVVKNPYRR